MRRALTELPAEFTLTSELLHWMQAHHYTHAVERYEYFCDYARANGKRYKDWPAAFRNSVRGDWARLSQNGIQVMQPQLCAKCHGSLAAGFTKRREGPVCNQCEASS